MPSTKLDVPALYAVLDQKRQEGNLSWRDVAKRLDVSPSTFTRMSDGLRPDVDTFATLIHWLGLPADRFMVHEGADSEAEQESPIVMISSYLRSAKNVRAEDAEALDDILRAAWKHMQRGGD